MKKLVVWMDLAIFWVVQKKNIRKKFMFKICFRTQITQKTYSKNNDFLFVFSEKVGSLDCHFLGGLIRLEILFLAEA